MRGLTFLLIEIVEMVAIVEPHSHIIVVQSDWSKEHLANSIQGSITVKKTKCASFYGRQ